MYLLLYEGGRRVLNKIAVDSAVAMKRHRRSTVRKNAMSVTGFQGLSSIGVRPEPDLPAERLPLSPYPLFIGRFSCYEYDDGRGCSQEGALTLLAWSMDDMGRSVC